LIRIDFTHQAQGPKNFALYFLILTFPAGHFTKCPGFCPTERPKTQKFHYFLLIPNHQPCRQGKSVKLTAFGGTFLATLPIFAIITNFYTIKLKINLACPLPAGRQGRAGFQCFFRKIAQAFSNKFVQIEIL